MTLAVFLAETTARLDLLQQLSCENDRAYIQDSAHALKRAAAALGLRQLSQRASCLERAALAMSAADYRDHLAHLAACFQLARREAELGVGELPAAA